VNTRRLQIGDLVEVSISIRKSRYSSPGKVTRICDRSAAGVSWDRVQVAFGVETADFYALELKLVALREELIA
jgi:hypothetical protein